jgi:hypothetical protein
VIHPARPVDAASGGFRGRFRWGGRAKTMRVGDMRADAYSPCQNAATYLLRIRYSPRRGNWSSSSSQVIQSLQSPPTWSQRIRRPTTMVQSGNIVVGLGRLSLDRPMQFHFRRGACIRAKLNRASFLIRGCVIRASSSRFINTSAVLSASLLWARSFSVGCFGSLLGACGTMRSALRSTAWSLCASSPMTTPRLTFCRCAKSDTMSPPFSRQDA